MNFCKDKRPLYGRIIGKDSIVLDWPVIGDIPEVTQVKREYVKNYRLYSVQFFVPYRPKCASLRLRGFRTDKERLAELGRNAFQRFINQYYKPIKDEADYRPWLALSSNSQRLILSELRTRIRRLREIHTSKAVRVWLDGKGECFTPTKKSGGKQLKFLTSVYQTLLMVR